MTTMGTIENRSVLNQVLADAAFKSSAKSYVNRVVTREKKGWISDLVARLWESFFYTGSARQVCTLLDRVIKDLSVGKAFEDSRVVDQFMTAIEVASLRHSELGLAPFAPSSNRTEQQYRATWIMRELLKDPRSLAFCSELKRGKVVSLKKIDSALHLSSESTTRAKVLTTVFKYVFAPAVGVGASVYVAHTFYKELMTELMMTLRFWGATTVAVGSIGLGAKLWGMMSTLRVQPAEPSTASTSAAEAAREAEESVDCTCSISLEPFRNPVFVLEDGYTYEKSSIEEHIRSSRGSSIQSPLMGSRFDNLTYLPNHALEHRAEKVSRDQFRCPITKQPLKKPYYCKEDGHTYEFSAIQNWFNEKRGQLNTGAISSNGIVSPADDRTRLSQLTLYPNKILFKEGIPTSSEPLTYTF